MAKTAMEVMTFLEQRIEELEAQLEACASRNASDVDRIAELKALLKEADDYLNTNNQTNIAHGSILHGKFAAAWRDKDPHEHDGIPCSRSCTGHHSHPCEKCGRQWPVSKIAEHPKRPQPEYCGEGEIPRSIKDSL